jgi:nickel-dependent lactate racemase
MTDTVVELPYGDAFITAAVPSGNISAVVGGRHLPGLGDEAAAIREALAAPVGCPGLRDSVKGGDRVVVITTDNTRHCPDDRILPVMLAELEKKVPRENITVMVALGLHPPLTRGELAGKLGEEIIANYRVVNHDPEQTVSLGKTSFGTPVEVNKVVAGADFRISTGFIVPHFFAGFSGGRKSIAPGVSSAAAIRYNHSYEMVAHPGSRAGVLDGNPIHEDMVEQAAVAGLDFIVNVLLNRERRITRVFAGDFRLAHEAACRVAGENVRVELDRPADITIVTNGGAPLDLDFYQTCKGIDTAAQVTREGGIIIIASACSQGVGPESFRALHAGASSPEGVMEIIRNSENGGVNWQNQILARAQMNHSVYLVSGLDDELARQMMVTPAQSVEAGLEMAFGELGRDAGVVVVPEGPLVLPVVKK